MTEHFPPAFQTLEPDLFAEIIGSLIQTARMSAALDHSLTWPLLPHELAALAHARARLIQAIANLLSELRQHDGQND
jgi:hypothetical protein